MGKYTLVSRPFPPLQGLHHGTGPINKNNKWLVQPWTVDRPVREQLGFEQVSYSVKVMSFEIATSEAPNWFGVSFREGINYFDSVNIFCHPSPGTAGMGDGDYPTRSGKWPELFRYAEMLGSQMAVACCDQIVIVPFFNNASYTNTGLFGGNWKDLVEDILKQAQSEVLTPLAQRAAARDEKALKAGVASYAAASALAPVLKDVVLSDFSFGRQLMRNIRAHAVRLGGYLREVWDFDGVNGSVPYTGGGVRGIIYDQQTVSDQRSFHVPGRRWLGYHGKNAPYMNVHSNIPDMLAWHAATITSVRTGSRRGPA